MILRLDCCDVLQTRERDVQAGTNYAEHSITQRYQWWNDGLLYTEGFQLQRQPEDYIFQARKSDTRMSMKWLRLISLGFPYDRG